MPVKCGLYPLHFTPSKKSWTATSEWSCWASCHHLPLEATLWRTLISQMGIKICCAPSCHPEKTFSLKFALLLRSTASKGLGTKNKQSVSFLHLEVGRVHADVNHIRSWIYHSCWLSSTAIRLSVWPTSVFPRTQHHLLCCGPCRWTVNTFSQDFVKPSPWTLPSDLVPECSRIILVGLKTLMTSLLSKKRDIFVDHFFILSHLEENPSVL